MKVALALLFLALAGCGPQETTPRQGGIPGLDGHFEFGSLTIVNDAGEQLEFDVYIAANHEQRRQGLMYVRNMPERTGMLFIYEGEDIQSMWMKNTYISLDMVFARADGSVTNVIANTTPHTLSSNTSTAPAKYVVELNAGTTQRMGIGKNSRLLLSGL